MPRAAAIRALLAAVAGMTAQEAMDRESRGLAIADRRLCADLLYGTLRTRLRIRASLAKFLKKPEKLPPPMLAALETAVYSLNFQDAIPAYAAVNETVKFVKKKFGQKLANLANGALRAVQAGEKFCENDGDFGQKALYYSVPVPIAELWRKAYGEENALKLLARSFRRPFAGLRVNPRNPDCASLLAALEKAPGALKICETAFGFGPGETPTLLLGRDLAYWRKAGAISRQACGSQLVLRELGINESWGDAPIWDACAGVGGKTAAMLESGLNVVLATDTNARRLRILGDDCKRLGLPAPEIAMSDACKRRIWNGNILLDAPCSGLGTLARRPDLKLRFSAVNTDVLIRMQARLLENLTRELKPERELAYITCTLNPAENEDQIASLCERRPDLELVRQWQTPHESSWLEGMYGARLRKKTDLPA